MNKNDEALVKALTARIERLEVALQRYQKPPSDVAGDWRRRLQRLNSPWRVFTMNKGQKPLNNGLFIIGRVLNSDPENFIVAKKQETMGERRKAVTIENWIQSLEEDIQQ